MTAATIKKVRLGSVYTLRRRPIIGHVSGISSHAQYGLWSKGNRVVVSESGHEQTRKRLQAVKKARKASLRKFMR